VFFNILLFDSASHIDNRATDGLCWSETARWAVRQHKSTTSRMPLGVWKAFFKLCMILSSHNKLLLYTTSEGCSHCCDNSFSEQSQPKCGLGSVLCYRSIKIAFKMAWQELCCWRMSGNLELRHFKSVQLLSTDEYPAALIAVHMRQRWSLDVCWFDLAWGI